MRLPQQHIANMFAATVELIANVIATTGHTDMFAAIYLSHPIGHSISQ